MSKEIFTINMFNRVGVVLNVSDQWVIDNVPVNFKIKKVDQLGWKGVCFILKWLSLWVVKRNV